MIIIKIRFSSVLVFKKSQTRTWRCSYLRNLTFCASSDITNDNITQSWLAAASMEKCKKSLFDYLRSDMIMTLLQGSGAVQSPLHTSKQIWDFSQDTTQFHSRKFLLS